jgi:hypothetical protein
VFIAYQFFILLCLENAFYVQDKRRTVVRIYPYNHVTLARKHPSAWIKRTSRVHERNVIGQREGGGVTERTR